MRPLHVISALQNAVDHDLVVRISRPRTADHFDMMSAASESYSLLPQDPLCAPNDLFC